MGKNVGKDLITILFNFCFSPTSPLSTSPLPPYPDVSFTTLTFSLFINVVCLDVRYDVKISLFSWSDSNISLKCLAFKVKVQCSRYLRFQKFLYIKWIQWWKITFMPHIGSRKLPYILNSSFSLQSLMNIRTISTNLLSLYQLFFKSVRTGIIVFYKSVN